MIRRNAIALGTCITLVSLGASAQTKVEGDIKASSDGYISVGGMVLKTGTSDCLRTGTFSDENMINACEGIAEEVAETVPETVTPVAKAPEPVKAKIDTREFSEMALFDTGSANLNSAGNSALNGLFSALSAYKGITSISVIGHTDSMGSEANNMALSERRAATVAAALAGKYPDARIEAIGMGESAPVATNETAAGRQQNRRVEIELTATRMTFE